MFGIDATKLLLLFIIFISIQAVNVEGNNRTFIGNAYVITMHDKIPWKTSRSALAIGFNPIRFEAITPDPKVFKNRSDMLDQCIPEINMTWIRAMLSDGEIALICSHRRVLEKIANDANLKPNGWSLILEDDATLNPNVKNPKALVAQVFNFVSLLINSDGFVYLGLKVSPSHPKACNNYLWRRYKVDLGADCHGHGTHAYAVTKMTATSLFKKVYSPFVLGLGDHRPQIDQMFNRYYGNREKNKAYGHNFFIAPLTDTPESHKGSWEDHKGLLFQGGLDAVSYKKGTHLREGNGTDWEGLGNIL